MRPILLIVALSFVYISKGQTGEDYLKKMYHNFSGKWYRTISFTQQTDRFRNDSLIKTSIWEEAGIFPYLYRIDIDRNNHSGVIYTRDSTYRFNNGTLISVTAGTNPFTFLSGGMYNVPYDTTTNELKKEGYDISKAYSGTWQGRKIWVIGACSIKDTSNQFWVDARNMYLVRTITKEGDRKIDAWMSDHIFLNGGWSERKVKIYINEKLFQIETYKNIKVNLPLNKRIFDPNYYSSVNF